MIPDLAVATAPKRNSQHWKQETVSWDDLVNWAENPASVKEAGNYLLGTLRPSTVTHPGRDAPCGPKLHRRKDFVVSRSAITLDIDLGEPDLPETLELTFPHLALLHTTFQSTREAPRYRLIIPTDRELMPDEYVVAAHALMEQLGPEQFDPGTDQPERYMFKPAAEHPEAYLHVVIEGDVLVVDDLLDGFEEDLSAKPLPPPHKNKRNPFELDGVIGAFNRAYADWDLLIQTYDLPYVRAEADRYQLVGARSVAGMGPVSDGLVFSHHVSDPAYGKACSAFDLVRLHRFGELDEGQNPQTPINRLPSHTACLDLVGVDPRVTAELVGVDFDAEFTDDPDLAEADQNDAGDDGEAPAPGSAPRSWRLGLRLAQRTGKFLDVIANWDLVRANDPAFAGIYFNELSLSVETDRDLPWRALSNGGALFAGVDRAALCHYIEREYGIRPTRGLMDELVDTTAASRRRNPIREYLDGLVWDGTERIETCLPGVRPTAYTRLVARKSLVAAVARIYEPGCKWDHTLVLYGSEGLGKSWWIEKLARGYSASLGAIGQKDTLLTMQRSWIMVADEGHSLKKADSDVQKEFLTRTEDVFRMPYDRDTQVHKRHCVIWSTTNDETFLRRQEGNRRFLIVHCEDRVNFDRVTDAYVDQLWAEAVHLYRSGELLFLADVEAEAAAQERERYIEEDALGGVITEYLEALYPDDWEDRSPDARVAWLHARDEGFEPEGDTKLQRVCTTQIWVEALRRRIGDHRRTDLLDIGNALKRLDGWTLLPGRHRLPGYGPQTIYVRTATRAEELEELI